jgi:hypothetical protein
VSQSKTVYGFDIEKIICFITRDNRVTETENTSEFMRDESLTNLLFRVSAWIKEINGECTFEEHGVYHIDTNDLTLYCRFNTTADEFTDAEKHLIRRTMKRA